MSGGLRYRACRLRVQTQKGEYGTEVEFREGLNVVWADNSMGKSTLMNALLFGLGLEGMITAKHIVPFAHVMTDRLDTGDGEVAVVASEVLLEIENGRGDVVTTKRTVVGDDDHRLVRVYDGALLTAGARPGQSRSLYARMAHSARREAGMQHFLAQFIGWRIPEVATFRGDPAPLYLETIFPLLFVEQKHGWGAIAGSFPTRFGIRDTAQRAFEFLMALDSTALQARRAELEMQLRELASEWKGSALALSAALASGGGQLTGVPGAPEHPWPPVVGPVVRFPHKGELVPLPLAIEQLEAELTELESGPVATAGQARAEALAELGRLQEQLVARERALGTAVRHHAAAESSVLSVERQLKEVVRGLARADDARKLERLAHERDLRTSSGACPTCGQAVTESLMVVDLAQFEALSLDDEVKGLNDRKKMLEFLLQAARADLGEADQEMAAMREEDAALRRRIRVLKAESLDVDAAPSASRVQRRVELVRQLGQARECRRQFDEVSNVLERLAGQHATLSGELKRIPSDTLSEQDRAKLAQIEARFIDGCRAFGLSSLDPAELEISRTSFQPEHEGFDLQFDLSASDTIRANWAYKLALLDVANRATTNHAGALVFDEPRQQSASKTSFSALIRRSEVVCRTGGQVIIATSEAWDNLAPTLEETLCHLVKFEGRVVTRR